MGAKKNKFKRRRKNKEKFSTLYNNYYCQNRTNRLDIKFSFNGNRKAFFFLSFL